MPSFRSMSQTVLKWFSFKYLIGLVIAKRLKVLIFWNIFKQIRFNFNLNMILIFEPKIKILIKACMSFLTKRLQ